MFRKLLVLGAVAATTSCGTPLDDTRDPGDPGSFGHKAYTLACKRLAYSEDLADMDGTTDVSGATYRQFCIDGTAAPAKLYPAVSALDEERPDVTLAIDTGFPDDELDDLKSYLARNAFLTIYDDGTAEKAADRLAALFALLAADPGFTGAMARLDGRKGMRPAAPAEGLLVPVAHYPKLGDLLSTVPTAIAEGGAVAEEWRKLQLAAARELAAAEAVPSAKDPERTLNLAVGLLLGESPLLGTGTARWLARRDHRGLPIVEKDGSALIAPFVDKDGDGLADADADGRFVGSDGRPVEAPAPFLVPYLDDTAAKRDSAGRAQTAGGKLVYRYVDVDKTLVGALARDGATLFDPTRGTALDLLRGASSLLGKRKTVHKTYPGGASLDYRGYDASGSALLDVLHAYLTVLSDPKIDDTLGVVETLVTDKEATAARLLEALLATADLGKQYPAAKLAPGAPLYDDLMPVVLQILAEPGLTEDLLKALEDPAVRGLGKTFGALMTYKDAIDYNPTTQAVTGSLRTPVDRTQPDNGMNRSLMQRILHLIHDSRNHHICNKDGARLTFSGFPVSLAYDACELMEIDNLGVFYVQAIAYAKDGQGRVLHDEHGRPLPKAKLPINLPGYLEPFVTDDVMEDQSTISGFRFHPTPEALNRILFLKPTPDFLADVMDPPVCNDGDRFDLTHQSTLAALELGGFYDGIRPIVQAFADHDREDLFIDALSVLHSHWPSRQSLQHQRNNPNGHGYAQMSDVHAWEPLVAEVLTRDELWSAITLGAPVLNAIKAPSGRGAIAVLADVARFVFVPRAGTARRDGSTTSTTEDGRPISPLSVWHVLADAYKTRRTQLDAAGSEGQLWQESTGELLDVLARGESAGGTWRFRNPRFRGITASVSQFVRARLTRHRSTGDTDHWLKVELPADLERVLTGPMFAGAADVTLALSAAPQARAALEALLVHLNTDGTPAFDRAVTGAADLLQWYADDTDLVPITRAAGRALDPELGVLEAQLQLVKRARAADTDGQLAGLLARLEDDVAPGRTALAIVADTIAEVHRMRPFTEQGKPLAAADYVRVLTVVGDFLDDEKRGLIKFARIVQNRGADADSQ